MAMTNNFGSDELKSVVELQESIMDQYSEIKQIEIDLAINNEEELLLTAESVPYKKKIDEINKQIRALEEQRALLRNQSAEITAAIYEKQDKKKELKGKKENKKKYIERLKALLNRKKTQEEKDAKLAAEGERLQAKASEFHWYSEIKGYQLDAAKQIAVMGKAIDGDEMGLGKSLTSLAAADLVGSRRLLIISKRDIVSNFKKEVELWCPHRINVFCSIEWTKKHVKNHVKFALPHFSEFVVLMNFEALWNDEDLLADLINLQFDAVIIDEAHHMKEEKKQNFINIKKLCQAANKCTSCGHRKVQLDVAPDKGLTNDWICAECGNIQTLEDSRSVKMVLPMTGSPILNRPDEIWPLLNLVDPKAFPDKRSFLMAYCTQTLQTNLMGRKVMRYGFMAGGANRLLREIGPRFIRRTKKEVGLELPPQKVTVHNIPFSEETHPLQYRAYHDLLNEMGMMFEAEGDYGTVVARKGTSLITRLRQVTSLPAGIVLKTRDQETGQEKILFECDIYESAKLDAAFEEAVELIQQGIRIVFFSKHVAPLEEMQKRLDNWREGDKPIRSVIYSGKTPLWEREKIQRDFDAKTCDPENYYYDIVLCQLDAASQGLNFTDATHISVIERPWGPKLEEQMLARTNRIGQTKENTVSIFQLKDTIDEDIEQLLYAKEDDVTQFESSAATVQKLMDKIFKGAKKGTLDSFE